MSLPFSSGAGRIETLPMTATLPSSFQPVVSQLSEPVPLDPMAAAMEHVLASVAKLETQLSEIDRRTAIPRSTPRPDPDPPYGLPSAWRPGFTQPGFAPTTATVMAIPTLPLPSSGLYLQQSGPLPSFSSPPGFTMPNYVTQAQYQHQQSVPNFLTQPQFQHQQSGFSSWDRPQSTIPSGGELSTVGQWQPGEHLSSQWSHPDTRQFGGQQLAHIGSSWDNPATRNYSAFGSRDQTRHVKMEPPRFDGSDASSWISRVQCYFDHIMLPEDHRLHYVVMLFDPPVADWVFNYRANNTFARWPEFLEDVRRRFDPKYFVNYMGLIAKLRQTGTLAEYNREFETMWNNLRGIPDPILLPVYIEGLQQLVKNQVRFQHPQTVAAAIALAQGFDSAIDHPTPQPTVSKRNWQPREFRSAAPGTMPGQQPAAPSSGRRASDLSRLPVVHISAAEKAERSKKGLCWYCPEKWVPGHACSRNFLAYMGVDEEDDEDDTFDEEQSPPEVISADLSHTYAMEGRQRSDSIELRGTVRQLPV